MHEKRDIRGSGEDRNEGKYLALLEPLEGRECLRD